LGILDKTIVNIQGLCYIYEKHYNADLPNKVVNNFTLRDLLKWDNITLQKKKFLKRGKYEIEALKLAKNVIGRTDWDKACTLQINPSLKYFHCNETLRSSFYEKKWEYENCEKHSIFVSQASYPIKGFHKMIEALTIIVKQFPDVKVYTTGKDLLNLSFKDKLKLNSYQRYLIKLIKKNNLQNNIQFLGFLDETQMCDRYLKSNCFVSCSAIENSPNSVGEATLLGVPTVSSDVGGVKNLLMHNEEGYVYPFNESYMLAYYVGEIFKNNDLIQSMSKNARLHAKEIYDKENNINTLIKIYKRIK